MRRLAVFNQGIGENEEELGSGSGCRDLWGAAGDSSEEKTPDSSLGTKPGSSGSWSRGDIWIPRGHNYELF